jgi:hypothetical protein
LGGSNAEDSNEIVDVVSSYYMPQALLSQSSNEVPPVARGGAEVAWRRLSTKNDYCTNPEMHEGATLALATSMDKLLKMRSTTSY